MQMFKNTYFFHFFWLLENQIQYFGSPSNATLPQSNTLMSPFFPSFYPRDLVIEHVFKCNDTDSDDCRLEFTFSDFQISETSAIEVKLKYKQYFVFMSIKLNYSCSFTMVMSNS